MTDFSYQLYSSRNFGPLGDTLSMLAEAGYRGVEGYGALYADASKVAELQAKLDQSGLIMPTAHVGLDMIENDAATVLALASDFGIQTVYCPFLTPDQRPSDADGYAAFGRRLQEAGKPLKDAGLGFGWHNHDFEFVALPDGAIPMQVMLGAAPDLEWEADIAWVIKGGADPLEWIANHGPRISAVHVKDIAPAGEATDEDGWADVGHGTVDWPGLMKALRNTPAKHFVMEHDNPNDDVRFARRSLEAAKTY
ncbi:sugar phosphate isomerase/epimerase family protein [Amaricoccus tamworthensis]|uniref:sugar phosphate isomerase/epimerase family protein n=1 Tax=Amaricoccus tamworthensis TaxID=57002 RepID=UPI003C7A1302